MVENGTESKPLTVQRHKAIASLLVSKNIRQAAEQSGVPERTLWRRCGDPRFRAAPHSAEGGIISEATRRLLMLADKAIEALDVVLSEESG